MYGTAKFNMEKLTTKQRIALSTISSVLAPASVTSGTFCLSGTGSEINVMTKVVTDTGTKIDNFLGNNAASNLKKARFCTKVFF
jgi:hypothetical protein